MHAFKNISNQDLVTRLEKLVQTERKITHQVLLHIAEIETRRIFAELGFESMYSYLTRGLGYSDGAAYRRLQSARLLNQVPEIAEKLEAGKLNLTQLTQVQKCLKKESKKSGEVFSKDQTLKILEKIENQNSFETQKTLACEMNLPVIAHEKIRPQQDESVRLEITFTKEQYEDLERAKGLLSHICPDGNWAEVISTLASQFNKKKLVGRKPNPHLSLPAKNFPQTNEKDLRRTIVTGPSENERQSESTNNVLIKNDLSKSIGPIHARLTQKLAAKRRRIYISIKHKRSLLEKANHCCEYVNKLTGKKCQSKYQLEIDHIQPLALGGSHEIKNLRILCKTHNLFAARKAGLPSGEKHAELDSSRQAKSSKRASLPNLAR